MGDFLGWPNYIEELVAAPIGQRKRIVAFTGELAVSSDFEGRSCGSRDFDQSCRFILVDHFGAIPAS